MRGGSDFLSALRGKMLKGFVASHHAGAYRRWLGVEHTQPVKNAALLCVAEPVEARLAAEGTFLLLRCQVLMAAKPLGKAFVAEPLLWGAHVPAVF